GRAGPAHRQPHLPGLEANGEARSALESEPPQPVRGSYPASPGATRDGAAGTYAGQQFLAAMREHPGHAFYVPAISTGMRQGELLGLAWSYVDLDAGHLH